MSAQKKGPVRGIVFRGILALAPLALLWACSGEQRALEPAEVAEAQFRAYRTGHLDSFAGHFTEDARAQLRTAKRANSRVLSHARMTTDEVRDSVIATFVKAEYEYAIPIFNVANILVPEELIEFGVLESDVGEDHARVRVRITYPDYRQVLAATYGRATAHESRLAVESRAAFSSDLPAEEKQAKLDSLRLISRQMELATYRANPERFREELIGTYELKREGGAWKVVREPLTEAIVHGHER